MIFGILYYIFCIIFRNLQNFPQSSEFSAIPDRKITTFFLLILICSGNYENLDDEPREEEDSQSEIHIPQEGENQVTLIELYKSITIFEGCKNQEEDSSLPCNNCGVLWSNFCLNCGDRG